MKDIYSVALFKDEGFERKQCISCGRTFWTIDTNRKTCGDTPCDEYTFIGNSPTRKRYTLPKMEKSFLKFFEGHKHTIIDRYPVVARWRDDIFLTIASIADFQPWVTGGLVPPPANPLVISQPSIRLNDIDNVGRSGRHFTLFFMGGHHAFNSHRKQVYWTDKTVSLCHEFLTRELGIQPSEISYIQDFWEGGGNAGEDFEVNVRGLELATLVFMHYAVKGGKNEPLPLNIVDTGYGIERLTWMSQGTPSSYEAIFGPVVESIRTLAGINPPPEDVARENSKLAGLIDIETGRDLVALRNKVASRTGLTVEELSCMMIPLEAVYAIADHLRCLAFMFLDGITPSNVEEGYLARLVLRRALRLMHEIKLQKPLAELMAMELEQLAEQFPKFKERSGYIIEVVGLEEKRYRDAISRGSRLVERLAGDLKVKGQQLPPERLVELYDSHGLPPEIVEEIAVKAGATVEVPEDFYIRVANLHSKTRRPPAPIAAISKDKLRQLQPTDTLYYDDPYLREFNAKVVGSFGSQVILDRTAFYPEGGGQLGDVGEFTSRRGKAEVLAVQKSDGVILHRVRPNIFKVGHKVSGRIDWAKRSSLMRHHTGTHILLGAARRVLGEHVWQHGVQKGVERTRLDISHFKRISPKELRDIELLANKIVMEDRPVKIEWMDRNIAERKYGFDLYQGGVVPGKKVRVVDIEDWNTQACAGTHYLWTGEVGFIKILRTERIADGVERLEFAAGGPALKFVHQQEEQISNAAEILRAVPEHLVGATQQLFDQWKATKKEVERLRERLAGVRLEELKAKAESIGRVRLVREKFDVESVDELIKIAGAVTRENSDMVVAFVTIAEQPPVIVVMAGEEAVRAGVNCAEIAAEAARVLGGGGGGKPEMGQGGGPDLGQLDAAMNIVVDMCELQQAR